jgi:hypothetical protein
MVACFDTRGEAFFSMEMELERFDESSKEYLPDFDLDYLFVAPWETTSVSSMSIRLNDCPGIQVLPRVSPTHKDEKTGSPVGVTLGAPAADVTGKWTAQVRGREGETREVTFKFKADGNKLAGTMSARQGQELAISDGEVSGDTITFTLTLEFGGNTLKQNYTGKIVGEEIQFQSKLEGRQDAPREFVAKRAK